MKIRKVDDKPMVIHTKEKAKIHAHEPKGAKIKGSNIYTVERGPKTAGAKVTDTDRKKSYRKSTIHQSEPKNKGLSRFKQNLKESNTSIKTKNTNLHIAGRTGALVAGAVTDQVEGGQEVSQAAYLAYEAKNKVSSLQNEINSYKSKIEECRRVIRKAKWYQWAKMAKETAKIVGYEVAIGGIYLAMKTAEAALDAANKVLSLANKLGSGFLNTINKVIQGVLNVFYISKALLGIIVNGSQIFVKVNMELTVIGKQISVKEEVDMNKLIEKPIILLEELTINQIKDLIDMLSLGQTPEYERIEATPYPYMEFPEDPVELSEMVAYGAKRIEQAKGMVEELQDLYIDELQELDSEIEDMDTEFKAAAQMVSYSLEKASDNVYIDGMDELITQIEEAKEDGQISPEEIKLAESCIDDYLNIIRPSATTIEESSMRVKECVDSIDTERTTKRMRSSYKNADAENGTELMNNRDYDKFYGELQSVVEKYFPHGSGHGYFNITDEEVFYQALNNARKQAGCAYVELSEEDEEENQESGLLYGAKPLRRMVSEGYIQRLQ